MATLTMVKQRQAFADLLGRLLDLRLERRKRPPEEQTITCFRRHFILFLWNYMRSHALDLQQGRSCPELFLVFYPSGAAIPVAMARPSDRPPEVASSGELTTAPVWSSSRLRVFIRKAHDLQVRVFVRTAEDIRRYWRVRPTQRNGDTRCPSFNLWSHRCGGRERYLGDSRRETVIDWYPRYVIQPSCKNDFRVHDWGDTVADCTLADSAGGLYSIWVPGVIRHWPFCKFLMGTRLQRAGTGFLKVRPDCDRFSGRAKTEPASSQDAEGSDKQGGLHAADDTDGRSEVTPSTHQTGRQFQRRHAKIVSVNEDGRVLPDDSLRYLVNTVKDSAQDPQKKLLERELLLRNFEDLSMSRDNYCTYI